MADLQRSLDDASDARDLAKDVLRQLPDYDGNEEESTARHDLPPQRLVVENHVHLDSVPDKDSEPPVRKQVRAGLIAVGSGIGLALLTGIAALLQTCGHH